MNRLTAEDIADHREHRDDDGRDHHFDAPGEPDGREHRIQGEDDVEDADLRNDEPEAARGFAARRSASAFQEIMDLLHALHDEQHAAPEQHGVAQRDLGLPIT